MTATIIFRFVFLDNSDPPVVLTSTELTGAAAPTVNISSTALSDGAIASVVSGGALTYDSYTKSWSYRLASADLASYVYVAMATTTYATAAPASVHALGLVGQSGDSYPVVTDAGYGNSALATLLTGKIKRYLMLLFRKDAAIKSDYATELGEINANTGTGAGAYDNATDSGEALRDRGDTAWLTATGFSTLTQQNVADALKLAPTAGDPVAGSVNAHLDAILEDTGTTLDDKLDAVGPGVGAHSLTYTLTDSGTGMPVADVLIELSTDAGKANVIRAGRTDSFGQVTFYLSAAGTYYVWRTKDGFSATDPDTEVVA